MTRTLWLLRHAKAANPGGVADHERPLAADGRADAEDAGQLLADAGRLDLVLCSSALRTQETWQSAEAGGASALDVEYRDELYNAGAPDVLATIRAAGDSVRTLLVIGHGPGLPATAAQLAAAPDAGSDLRAAYDELGMHYPTCGLTRFDIDGDWADLDWGTATLRAFEVPRHGAG